MKRWYHMERKKAFERYYARLSKEGVLKSLLAALICGFAVNFILGFALWAADIDLFWIAILAGVAVAGAAMPLFYFKRFRPTAKQIAERVDRLGLQERLITMLELENDSSYIALRQREDAFEKLSRVDPKRVRMNFSKAAIVIVAVIGVLAVSMTTVGALSAAGVGPSFDDVKDRIDPPKPPEMVAVSYVVDPEEGGFIEGEADQIVEEGKNAETVTAVPEDGWAFVGWDEEETDSPNPVRRDLLITAPEDGSGEITHVAHFVQLSDGDGNGEGDSSEPQDGEGDQSAPGDPSSNSPDENQQQDPGGAGGKYENNDYIIDGETYYRDVMDQYYQDMLDILESGGTLPDYLREIIEAYFGIIK